MKKIICSAFILMLGINIANAKPVLPASAKTVAENFYKQNAKIAVSTVTLAYTQLSDAGLPVFYVFNINASDGFVIVTAEDAVKPILGYSTKNKFVIPENSTNIDYWLKYRTKEISSVISQNLVATVKTANEWAKYTGSNSSTAKLNNNSSVQTAGVQPLVQTTWNQNGGGSVQYNNLCPGGSVTGCVETAMAQIMRYWSYPAQGMGSSSYNEQKSTGDYENYGVLSANYGATTYNWASMPLNASNANVAQLMFQCGVSVNMDYSPSESGAWVITGDNPVCAQHSYITYFGYDPNIIQGLYRSGFADADWIALIESDLNIGRPVQYVGDDPTQGGHTWVCDGYDANDNLHMNWGWGGSDDGYYTLDQFTTAGGFDPINNNEILMGIVPLAKNALDIGVPAITAPVGSYCGTNSFNPVIQLKNYGSSLLSSCIINYELDNNGAVQIQNWSGSLVTGQVANVSLPAFTATAGTHTLTCYSSNPNDSADANSVNDQTTILFTVTPNGILPVIEGFEAVAALPNSDWTVSHTGATGVDWAVTTNGAASGSKSAMIDNMNNTAGNNSILQTSAAYDLTTFATPAVSFKVAYQQKSSSNNDKLQVYASTDCGTTWVSKWSHAGATLSTVSGTIGTVFMPTNTEFTTYTVNVNSLAADHSVIFRWEFYADPNGPGNNLYLDDINIIEASTAGIQNIETAVNLNLYPNPSSSQVNIGFSLSEKHSIAVTVTDMLGRSVETIAAKSYQAGESTISIGANATYQAGIYLVHIDIDGQRIAKKIVIQ